MINFKDWMQQEMNLGSDGSRDNNPAQTAQSTVKVAQNWLSSKNSVDLQNKIATGGASKSSLGKDLLNAGNQAIKSGISGDASKTNAPAVASFIQKQFKAPSVIKSPIIK